MDEYYDELRFVCKLCDKRYPSGKSLGGHMRSHVIAAANSVESDEKFEPIKKLSTLTINGNHENENGNYNLNTNYGLRENPKRSWRAVGSSSSTLSFPNEQICKQCGKGFQSLKALCGHMAFHSDKDRGLKDYDHSWTIENNLDHENDNESKLVEDSQSDTEENEHDQDQDQDPIFITRSKSKRYKKIVVKPSTFMLTNTNTSNNSNYNYGSSSVSEIDEFEQEDVAMWLMMLSKDSTNWGGVNSVVETSDNNSFVLEAKLDTIDMKNGKKEWNLAKNEVETSPIENSSSGYGSYGIKNLTYEEKLEIRRNLLREFGYDISFKKITRNVDDDSCKKRNKYECMNCNKTFSSFQGLGGHRPCHKKNSGGNNSEREFNGNQKAKFEKKTRPQKNKGHECPICYRMFKSGQALGGHKRSHFINGIENRFDHLAAMEHENAKYSDMIDLNLPAPEED